MPAVSAWPFPEKGGLKTEWTAAMECVDRLGLTDFHRLLPSPAKEQLEALSDLANEIARNDVECRLALGVGCFCTGDPELGRGALEDARRRVNAAFTAGWDFQTILSIEVV